LKLRSEGKERVLEALLTGRCDLSAAAAGFHDVDVLLPVRSLPLGDSASYHEQVLTWVKATSETPANRVHELEAELEALRAKGFPRSSASALSCVRVADAPAPR
jgi:hypothetical protein